MNVIWSFLIIMGNDYYVETSSFQRQKKKVWSSTKRHAFRCSSGGVLVEEKEEEEKKKGRQTRRKHLSSFPEDSFRLSVWARCFFAQLLRSQQYKSKFNSNAASTAVKYVWHHLISETPISVLVRWSWFKKKEKKKASFKKNRLILTLPSGC